jgi:hypothetical protein
VLLYTMGMSSSEIAVLFNLSGVHVARIVRKFGYIRTASERQRLSHSRPAVKAKLSKASKGRPCPEHVKQALRERTGANNHNWGSGLTISNGYVCYTASPENGSNAGKLFHRAVVEVKLGRTLARHEVVHHIDHNPLYNHPSNLRVMTQAEHMALHAQERKQRKECK